MLHTAYCPLPAALFFKEIKPGATMVEVRKLVDPELLTEIERTAIVDKDM